MTSDLCLEDSIHPTAEAQAAQEQRLAEGIQSMWDDMEAELTRLRAENARLREAAEEALNLWHHNTWDELEAIAAAFVRLGDELSAECDEAEEADDRRRGNPLERDYRRYGA